MQLSKTSRKKPEIQHSMIPEMDVMASPNHGLTDAQVSKTILLRQIQQDHAQIQQFLSSVRETCSYLAQNECCASCTSEQKTLCASRAPSYLYDLLDLPARHFLNEEALMLLLESDSRAGYELPENPEMLAHREAHAHIMLAIRETYAICLVLRDTGQLNQMYRLLHTRIETIFAAHEERFDRSLLARIKQEIPTMLIPDASQ